MGEMLTLETKHFSGGKLLPHSVLRGGSASRGSFMPQEKLLVGKPEGKRPLGRPRRRWEDNIKMDLQELGLVYEDWIGWAQDRDRWRALVCAVRNIRVP